MLGIARKRVDSVIQAARMGVQVVMVGPEPRLFCRLDGTTPATREQERLTVLAELGLLEAETVPVFEEATQTAARFLDAPICILGLMASDQQWLKSSVGLSRLGLMNKLAASRCLPRSESFCGYVVDSHQVLVISDTLTNPVFASSLLVQHYGIRAYLGVPLLTASGQCLGTLAVMDLVPRYFTSKEIEFLELTARWSLGEFERNRLLQEQQTASVYLVPKSSISGKYELANHGVANVTDEEPISSTSPLKPAIATNSIKVRLLTQMALELRTPLTSIMGMTSVLGREVYGPLSEKQKEYLEIIHSSGQHLVSLVDEILALEILDEDSQKLNITPVDIEMLCQQAINSLLQVAKIRQQQISLSIEPGNRIWSLDKDKIRQMLYYLVYSVVHSAEIGSVVRIHVSRKSERLNIAIWVSHPWLGDGLPQAEVYSYSEATAISNGWDAPLKSVKMESNELLPMSSLPSANQLLSNSSVLSVLTIAEGLNKISGSNNTRESLGLILSCQLAEINGGQILVQGLPESGYRYVVSLPQLAINESL